MFPDGGSGFDDVSGKDLQRAPRQPAYGNPCERPPASIRWGWYVHAGPYTGRNGRGANGRGGVMDWHLLNYPVLAGPRPGSATTFGASALGSSSLTRSNSGRPSLVNMKGMNTASKLRMPHSTAVTWPLIQSRRMLLTAT